MFWPTLKKTQHQQTYNKQGNTPFENRTHIPFGRQLLQRCKVSVLLDSIYNTGDMSRPHYCYQSIPGSRADFLSQIDITFIDKTTFHLGKGIGQGLHHPFHLILLFDFFNGLLVNFFTEKDTSQKLTEHFDLIPEIEISPDPFQGYFHVSIRADQSGPGLSGLDNAFHHLGSGLDPEFVTKFTIKRSQHKLHQDKQGLFFLDNLENIHFPPVIPISHGPVSGLAQFNADRVRPDCRHTAFNVFDAFFGHMRRTNKINLFAVGNNVGTGIR
jgi:hypothetical protein